MLKRTLFSLVLSAGILLATTLTTFAQDTPSPEGTETMPAIPAPDTSGYITINDLNMYYEIRGSTTQGSGTPLIALHGAYMTTDAMSIVTIPLAETRQVIAVDLQAHGRTNDVDRPLNYAQMADDVVALMDQLGIERADVFGYSMGGGVAQQIVFRHPERVNKLVVLATTFRLNGWHQDVLDTIAQITPEMFAGSPMETEYARVAPNPENFPTLVEKLVALDSEEFDWTAEVATIQAPTLVMVADNDGVRLEHAVEMYTLLGGGVSADHSGQPVNQFAVIPGASHVGVIYQPERVTSLISQFLDAPAPQAAAEAS